ncbi:hypothetical protein SAMD00019534_000430, partial [Acytostelium subglobosum LB1]|uniref:hypothetical protein n=1 Tax=Acytostelium subglobosum LB1 TaxID=1410327 RepID=UPI0006450515
VSYRYIQHYHSLSISLSVSTHPTRSITTTTTITTPITPKHTLSFKNQGQRYVDLVTISSSSSSNLIDSGVCIHQSIIPSIQSNKQQTIHHIKGQHSYSFIKSLHHHHYYYYYYISFFGSSP